MRRTLAVVTLALVVTSMNADAQVRGRDRQQVEKMVYATIYLRVEVPTNDKVEPFIQISPVGYSWDRQVGRAEAKAGNKPSGVYFPFRPNDVVRWGSVDYGGDRISVWFQGVRDELKVVFVQIKTLDDFIKAFDRVFARVPLQDEHPDWPTDVRRAIADGRLVEGMTKQQASCVVGVPPGKETSGEDREVWYPRQETGDKRSGHKATTGFPVRLEFSGDRLSTIGAAR